MEKAKRACLPLLLVVAAGQLLLVSSAGTALGLVTADQLAGRINELVRDIKSKQDRSGAFSGGGQGGSWPVGQTALGVLALRAAGVPGDDPVVSRAVEYLVANRAEGERGVYQVSLRIMALKSVDPKAHKDEIAAGARYLMRAQQGSGGWSYTHSGRSDYSNSQFALLGLNAAAESGVQIPQAIWESARQYYSGGQNLDGGWAYRPRSGDSYGSMTAAGVASLYICDVWLHIKDGRCGVYRDNRRLQKGLDWLADNFSVTRNPHHRMWKFYYLYALERAGVILARRYFGRHDWYRQGVEHLVGHARGIVRAPSRYEWPLIQDCFTLLFLAKGNAPILIHKGQWAGRWNANRYDARFLVQYVGEELEQRLDWQVLPLTSPLGHLMAAPILYLSGGAAVRWSPQEVARLEEYMDAGGFVLIEAANGDAVFDRAFRDLLKERFPEEELEALPEDHPIYTSYFDIVAGDRPRLEAIKGPCWISLLYAPDGLSCEWDVADFEHVNFKMGMNIVAYVTGLQRFEGKLTEPAFYVPTRRESEPRRGAFTLGQVVHGGDWRPHKRAWLKVLEQVSSKAGLAVYSRPLPIRVDVESPFQAQMLYLTGVGELKLNAETRKQLRRYLERGGFIFAEAACGSKRFDESFRKLMREPEMFPDQELKALPLGHPLFELGEPLDEVEYSPAVRRDSPELKRPVLEFIEHDGRAVILYSKYDLSSAIDGHPCYSCPSLLEPSASRLAIKIVLYGLSS